MSGSTVIGSAGSSPIEIVIPESPIDLLAEQLDRIEAKLDAMRWRPMESAPKDGRVIEMQWYSNRDGFARFGSDDRTNPDRLGWYNVLTRYKREAGSAWRPAHPEWKS